MDRSEFVVILSRLRNLHPNWFDLPADRRVDDDQIESLEVDLGARLPDDYWWFLREFGGGDFVFISVYSADPDSDLLVTRNQAGSTAPFLAVLDDGTGDFLGFSVLDGVCEDRMMVLDHETGDISPLGCGGFLDFVYHVGLGQAAEPNGELPGGLATG